MFGKNTSYILPRLPQGGLAFLIIALAIFIFKLFYTNCLKMSIEKW